MIVLDAAVLEEKSEPAAQAELAQVAFSGKLPYFTVKEYSNRPDAMAEAMQDCRFYSGKILAESQDSGGIGP